MKAALIDQDGKVVNVIVWDDTCTAPSDVLTFVIEDEVMAAPGWNFVDGHFIPPIELPD